MSLVRFQFEAPKRQKVHRGNGQTLFISALYGQLVFCRKGRLGKIKFFRPTDFKSFFYESVGLFYCIFLFSENNYLKGGIMKAITMNAVETEISINEAFKKFYKKRRIRNVAEDTLNYYEGALHYFDQYYSVENKCISLTQDIIDDYIEYMQKKGTLKTVTINTRLRGLRTIINYFNSAGYTKDLTVTLMKADEEIKEPYTEEELKRLLRKPNLKKCQFTEYRDWVIINYILATANRVKTIVNIKIR